MKSRHKGWMQAVGRLTTDPRFSHIETPALLEFAVEVEKIQVPSQWGTTAEKAESFKEAARPLIKWMAEHLHPHHTSIVTATGAELLEGEVSTGQMLDYIKD